MEFIIIIAIFIFIYFGYKENQKKNERIRKENEEKDSDYVKYTNKKKTNEQNTEEKEDYHFNKKTEEVKNTTKPIFNYDDIIEEKEPINHLNNFAKEIGFTSKETFLLLILDEYKREIEKMHPNDLVFASTAYAGEYRFKTPAYDGAIRILDTHKLVVFEAKILTPADEIFKEFYFNKDDDIKISMIIDLNNKVLDLLIVKQKLDGSFKEIGNYLYNYPQMTIRNFGTSQFSYLHASKLCDKLQKMLSVKIPDLNDLFK